MDVKNYGAGVEWEWMREGGQCCCKAAEWRNGYICIKWDLWCESGYRYIQFDTGDLIYVRCSRCMRWGKEIGIRNGVFSERSQCGLEKVRLGVIPIS